MYYTVYKTTCLVNGKIYIGKHKTKDLNDGYIGSGKLIQRAIDKHGVDNFITEKILLKSEEEMNELEELIVDEQFLLREDVYNLKIGGEGGWDHLNSKEGIESRRHTFSIWSKAGNEAYIEKLKDSEFREFMQPKWDRIGRLRNKAMREKYPNGTFYGKNHSKETKDKISRKSKERLKDPTKNSQYGTMWITNGTSNKKIKKDEKIPNGWRRGRICK